MKKRIIEMFKGEYFLKKRLDKENTFDSKLNINMITKIDEECREVRSAIIKYKKFKTESNKREIGRELFDVLQSTSSILTFLFTDNYINKLQNDHDKKIQGRMIKRHGKLPK